jgi:two-component system, NtrC family, sensor kinase
MKRFRFYFFVFCLVPAFHLVAESGDADPAQIESMITKLATLPDDTGKLILLNELVERIPDDDVWPAYNEQMGQLAEKLLHASDAAVKKAAKKYKGAYLNNQAMLFFYRSDVQSSIQLYHESLTLREEAGDKKGIAETLNNLSYALHQQGQTQDALANYQRCLVIEREINDSTGTALTLNNIGLTYSTTGQCAKALEYYQKSLKLRLLLNNNQNTAATLNNMGVCYVKIQDYEKAVDCFEKSLKISTEIEDKRGMAFSLTELAGIYFRTGHAEKALPLALRAHEIALVVGYPIRIKSTAQVLKNIYRANGDYRKAYEMQELETQMRDSLINEETRKSTLKQQYDYKYEREKASLLAAQEKKDTLALQKFREQRILIYAFLLCVSMLFIVVLLLINGYRSKQKANLALTAAYENLKAAQQKLIQNEKLASLGQLTASIAHEIKNPLNFVNNFAELSKEMISEIQSAKNEDERNSLLSELETNLSRISVHGKRANDIVRGMLHHSRSESGDLTAINMNELCEEALSLSYQAMRAKIPDFSCRIEKSLAENIPPVKLIHHDMSRVLLNLFNNAFYAVHVKAKDMTPGDDQPGYSPEIRLATRLELQRIVVSIRDNGNGITDAIRNRIFEPFFTTKPSGEGTGLGLSICYDIVKAHGGELSVETRVPEFTEFIIALPLS